MSSLTPIAHFHLRAFNPLDDVECMICFDKVLQGVVHITKTSAKENKVHHVAHTACLAKWVSQCDQTHKIPSCPVCNTPISERSLQKVFNHFSENNLATRSIYWQGLYSELLEKACMHQENKEEWKAQAEIVIDEFRFILDGIHRFYIGSSKKRWIDEPLDILTFMQSSFDLPKLALTAKQKGLPLPDHLHHFASLTPHMEKHVLKVVDFLAGCINTKKQMLRADFVDKNLIEQSHLYLAVAGAVSSAVIGVEAFNYFTLPDEQLDLLILKITGFVGFLAGLYKVATVSDQHLLTSFRKLSLDSVPSAIGDYVGNT